jgi:hypothetical protein
MMIPWQFIKKSLREKSASLRALISKNIFPQCNYLRNAKSLVKHLLTADLSKRFGNLKNGKFVRIWNLK